MDVKRREGRSESIAAAYASRMPRTSFTKPLEFVRRSLRVRDRRIMIVALRRRLTHAPHGVGPCDATCFDRRPFVRSRRERRSIDARRRAGPCRGGTNGRVSPRGGDVHRVLANVHACGARAVASPLRRVERGAFESSVPRPWLHITRADPRACTGLVPTRRSPETPKSRKHRPCPITPRVVHPGSIARRDLHARVGHASRRRMGPPAGRSPPRVR